MTIDPDGRTPSQRYAATLGRLRAELRKPVADTAAVFTLARMLGRSAHAAGHSVELLVEVLAGLAPADTYQNRMLPSAIIQAATGAYLTESDRPRDVLLD